MKRKQIKEQSTLKKIIKVVDDSLLGKLIRLKNENKRLNESLIKLKQKEISLSNRYADLKSDTETIVKMYDELEAERDKLKKKLSTALSENSALREKANNLEMYNAQLVIDNTETIKERQKLNKIYLDLCNSIFRARTED